MPGKREIPASERDERVEQTMRDLGLDVDKMVTVPEGYRRMKLEFELAWSLGGEIAPGAPDERFPKAKRMEVTFPTEAAAAEFCEKVREIPRFPKAA